MKKAILVLSGGMDSTALLLTPPDDLDWVGALSIDYGQRHGDREISAAKHACHMEGVPHQVAELSSLREILAGSALTDDAIPVPHGHYEHDSMRATVVPNRNMILLSIAAGYAISKEASVVAYAAHAGDHAIYPDCRTEFIRAMMQPLALCYYTPIELVTPFIAMSKADIVRRVKAGGSAMVERLAYTWSCYEGGDLHCGQCGTCVERREAFELAEVEDLTVYAEVTA